MKNSGKIKKILLMPLPNWLGYIAYTVMAVACLFFIYVVFITVTGTDTSLSEMFFRK